MSLLGAAEATDRWQRVPVGGELRPELQSEIFEPGYTTGTYRQDFAACVEATHASFLLNYTPFGRGFDSDAEEARTREAARLLGYALHLTEADLGPQTLTLTLENRGVAPFYHPVVVEVEDANGTATQTALPLLLPGSDPDEIALDVVNLAAPSPDAPWTVRLLSEHILPNQTLRLATAPGNGAIQVE